MLLFYLLNPFFTHLNSIRRVARNTIEDETVQDSSSGFAPSAQPGIMQESDAAVLAYIQGITPRSDAEEDAPAPLSGRLSERVHGGASSLVTHQAEGFSVGTELHTVDEDKQGEPNPPKMVSMSSKRRGNRVGAGGKAISSRATDLAGNAAKDRSRTGAKASEDSEGDGGYEGHESVRDAAARLQDEDSGAEREGVQQGAGPKRTRKKSDRNSFSKADEERVRPVAGANAREEQKEKARHASSHQPSAADHSDRRNPPNAVTAPPSELASAESRPWSQTMVMR